MTRLQSGQSRIWILRRPREFCLLHHVQTGSWGLPSLLFHLTLGSFLWVKRLGCGVDHSPPSSSEVRNKGGGGCMSAPPFCASLLWIGKTLPFCINTLRTGDTDLRFYVTTVQDGWRRFAFLTRWNLVHLQVLLSATPRGGMFPEVSHPQALLGSWWVFPENFSSQK